MLDRKTENILTLMGETRRIIDDMKTEQPIGADTTEIRLASGSVPYDALINPIHNGERAYVTINYNPGSLKEWQESTYNEIRWGIFIGNIGDTTLQRYHGEFVNVLPTQKLDAYSAQAEVQIVNTSGVDKQIVIQAFCLTTALSGTLNTSWFI